MIRKEVSATRSSFGRATRVTVAMGGSIAAVLLLVVTLHSPGARASRDADDDRPAAAAPATRPGQAAVKLDRDGQAKGGIETAPPTSMPYRDQVRVYGTVLVLDKFTGLYNVSLSAASQLRTAEVKLSASQQANERAQNLLKVFATAKAQAESAAAAYELDRVGVETARAQSEALRNTAIQDWGSTLGEAIVAQSPLAKALVLRKTCLVQVTPQPGSVLVPPRHITLTLSDNSTIAGDYVAEAPQADPRIQNVGFLYAVQAAPGLVPGMSTMAYLPKGDAVAGVGIPPSAVVWQDGKAWIYLRDGSDLFKRHSIDAQATPTADGGYVVPAASLPHDQTLVVAGAQTLLSEESRAQIPADEDDK